MENGNFIEQIGYSAQFVITIVAAFIAIIIIRVLTNKSPELLQAEKEPESTYKLHTSYMGPIIVFAGNGIFVLLGIIMLITYAIGYKELPLSPFMPIIASLFVVIPIYVIYKVSKKLYHYILIKIMGSHIEIYYPKNPSKHKSVAIKDCEFKTLELWTADEDTPLHYAGPILGLKYNQNEPTIYIKTYSPAIKWKESERSSVPETALFFVYTERWKKLIQALDLQDKLKQ
ncbi:hypothetical protein KKD70_01170 [Patescibacteria group bacterium]|nr:hypothetical protein [Patescibacteria group bacterium]